MSKAILLVTANWEQRSQAEKLGLAMPAPIQAKSKLLFYNRDVLRAFVDDAGSIMLVMKDDTYLEIEYTEKLWKELEIYFREHED